MGGNNNGQMCVGDLVSRKRRDDVGGGVRGGLFVGDSKFEKREHIGWPPSACRPEGS